MYVRSPCKNDSLNGKFMIICSICYSDFDTNLVLWQLHNELTKVKCTLELVLATIGNVVRMTKKNKA